MRRNLALLTGLTLAACGGDPNFTDRPPPEGGVVIPIVPGMDAEATEGGGSCPDNEPKLGDRCPPGLSEGASCQYQVDSCTAPSGAVYGDFLNYCCFQSLWVSCGGMSACDSLEAGVRDGPRPVDAAPPDAAPPDAPPADADLDAGAPDAGQFDADPDAGATD
jgi:hypothetical protein